MIRCVCVCASVAVATMFALVGMRVLSAPGAPNPQTNWRPVNSITSHDMRCGPIDCVRDIRIMSALLLLLLLVVVVIVVGMFLCMAVCMHAGYRRVLCMISISDPLRRSSVKIGTIQRRLAWPLRKADTHKSISVTCFLLHHAAASDPTATCMRRSAPRCIAPCSCLIRGIIDCSRRPTRRQYMRHLPSRVARLFHVCLDDNAIIFSRGSFALQGVAVRCPYPCRATLGAATAVPWMKLPPH